MNIQWGNLTDFAKGALKYFGIVEPVVAPAAEVAPVVKPKADTVFRPWLDRR
jgi:hypothetical protein